MRLAMEIVKYEPQFLVLPRGQHSTFFSEMGNKIREDLWALWHNSSSMNTWFVPALSRWHSSHHHMCLYPCRKLKKKKKPSWMVFWANNVKAEFIFNHRLCQSALENDPNPKIWNHQLLSMSISHCLPGTSFRCRHFHAKILPIIWNF